MLSFWEKQYLLNYDVIIIGSGIVGLSTAASIKEAEPGKRVLVLERAILPTGASTKNAGFACIGSLTEILDDLNYMPENEVLELVELRYKGLADLRQRLGDKQIGYAENGSYELISEAELPCLNELERVNQILRPLLKGDAFSICNDKISTFGFNANYTQSLISNNYEGELNTGMMMRSLIDYCLQFGIEIKTGCEVYNIEEASDAVNVTVNHAHLNQQVIFKGQQCVVCTNAFTRHFYPLIDVQPGRGQVLITKPIKGLKLKGVFHFDKGYYYFRNLGNRVLFGGGRNMDFEGEETTDFAYNNKVQQVLIDKLQNIILPNQPFEVEDWWTGIMAFGQTKTPLLVRQSSRIYIGVRMGGMGVAIGSRVGAQLAQMVLGG